MNRLSRIAKGIQAVLPRRLEDIERYKNPVLTRGLHTGSEFQTPGGQQIVVTGTVEMMTPNYLQRVSTFAPKLGDFINREFPYGGVESLTIMFSSDSGEMGVTGKGEEQHIFAGVIRAANDIMAQNSFAPLVMFSGKRDEGVRKRRTSIYERFASKLGGSLGYAKMEIGESDYYVTLNPHYETQFAGEDE